MIADFKWGRLFAGFALAFWALAGFAAEAPLNLALPASFARESQSFMLAANDSVGDQTMSANVQKEPAFEPKLLSPNKLHQYLGVSTALLAGAAFITHPHPSDPNAPRETNGTHAQLAKATVAMAAATVASGLLTHWDDFSTEDGWSDPDNLHVLLGVTGAALMAYAVNRSANSSTPISHAALSELGALGMVVAIKLTW